MSTDIQQLWRENSDCAVVGRKRFVKLGHLAPNAGEPFHHVDLNTHFGQIQCGLNSRDSAS